MIAVALLVSCVPAAQGQDANLAQANAVEAINDSLHLVEAGQYTDAIAAARLAIQNEPNNAVAYNNLAVAYSGLAQWDKAIAAIRKALQLQPKFELAVNNLASYLASKPAPLSLDELRAAAGSWLDLSLGYYQLERYPEAIEAARQALLLQPDQAVAYNNIGAAYGALGAWDAAMQADSEALRLNPNFTLAQNNLAFAEAGKQQAGGGPGQ
jgi:tetratricopeptide (TPR) repeat protein